MRRSNLVVASMVTVLAGMAVACGSVASIPRPKGTPGVEIPVEVVDDLGQPIANATVSTRWVMEWDPPKWSSGELPKGYVNPSDRETTVEGYGPGPGVVSVAGIGDHRVVGLAVLVEAEGHLPVWRWRAPDRYGEMWRFQLQRGATVEGVVRGWERVGEGLRLSVSASAGEGCSVGGDSARFPNLGSAGGERFRLEGLGAGDVRVGLGYSGKDPWDEAEPGEMRLFARWGSARLPRLAPAPEVAPGGTVSVELEVQSLGKVELQVLADGVPVPGAEIHAVYRKTPSARLEEEPFGVSRGAPVPWMEGMDPQGRWDLLRYPTMVADKQGKVKGWMPEEGVWWFAARGPGGVFAAPPVMVEPPPPGETLRIPLHLPDGSISGVWSGGEVPPEDIQVWVWHPALAGQDPWSSGNDFLDDWESSALNSPLCWRWRSVPLRDGSFRFPFLRDGFWVVRVSEGRERTLWQRAVDVRGGALVDLGTIGPLRGVEARVRCKLPPLTGVMRAEMAQEVYFRPNYPQSWRVHLLQPVGRVGIPAEPGRAPRGMFLMGALVRNGLVSFENVPPGRYIAQLSQEESHSESRWIGALVGTPMEIQIRPDGTTVPELLDWSGADMSLLDR